MASTPSGVGGYTTDTHELTQFAKRLRLNAPVEVKREVRRSVRDAALLVAAKAKENAAEHSKSIPPTVKVFVRGASAGVQAGNKDTPLAKLYEYGNKGAGGRSAFFYHPTFGHLPSKRQKRYPFLRRAAEEKGPEAAKLVKRALLEGVRKGLR